MSPHHVVRASAPSFSLKLEYCNKFYGVAFVVFSKSLDRYNLAGFAVIF